MATNPLPQVAWDTVVVIDFLDQKSGRFEFILPIAKDAEEKKLIIVLSMMAVVETTHLDGTPPDQSKTISDFFERPFIHREAAGLFVCETARDIRRAHPVDGADSIHLATAAFTNTPYFLTNDGTSKRNKKPLLPLDKKIRMANGEPLRIVTPEEYNRLQTAALNPLLQAAKEPPQLPPEIEVEGALTVDRIKVGDDNDNGNGEQKALPAPDKDDGAELANGANP